MQSDILLLLSILIAYDALFPSSVMKGKDTVHVAQEFIKVRCKTKLFHT